MRRAALMLALAATAAAEPPSREWTRYAGSAAADRYSPIDRINPGNVAQLRVLWERPAIDAALLARFPDAYPTSYFRGTPILVDGVLYAPDGIGLVEAFDPATGRTLWVQQPFAETMREMAGVSTRGVDHWGTGAESRILAVRGEWLYALDAKTGGFIRSFGDRGRVYLRRRNDGVAYFGSNGPMVIGDLVIVSGNGGGNAGDGGAHREGTPEDVRAYDVRTGRLVWTFHVMPQPGDPARASWGRGSAAYSGNMGAWATLSADEALGIVYVPLSSVSTAYYGGHRPGTNLYSNSLVALEARTGRLLWQRQLVHHDLWDYDTASPPTLGTVTVDGRRRDVVIQPSKTGYLFAFDRRTGEPIWPIVERAAPGSDVPGEAASPTQPAPSRPAPFDRQGISEADLIDFTPALNAQARAIAARYRLGPLFTPPSLRGAGGKQGTLSAPGAWGSGNWNTGAFDPETGWYYAVSMSSVTPYALERPTSADATIRYAFVGSDPAPPPETGLYGIGPQGLPLVKPPYGRITAYDMNRGDRLWVVANGDGPRDHPLLKGLNLPPLGTPGRPVPLLTRSLLFLGESSDAIFGEQGVGGPSTFRAYDKRTGRVLATVQLPAGATGGPMTYEAGGRQIVIVPVGSKRAEPRWIALGLPETAR